MRKQWYFLLCFCFCLVGCAKPEPHPVTQEEAEEMALKDAGIEEVYTIQTYLNSDEEYQVMFVSDHTLWNYEIEKDTGEIVEKDRDKMPEDGPSGPLALVPAETFPEDYEEWDSPILPIDNAVEILFDRVDGATQENLKIQLDHQDGYLVYTGEIQDGDTTYEFLIDPASGVVLEWNKK